ncbi:hypothetical protein D0Z07_8121 [Hyphodiscus hymeniophilus]|uniref:NmrA-like domain-containing protein n=1 Tax=Hyphodiscus hymeniophilus TaxID=353542 RepID=A0A9P6VE46_9HELO|nr:hypothetical protein D0Z07_8121 [Hyphodiscus hymeniophilus]
MFELISADFVSHTSPIPASYPLKPSSHNAKSLCCLRATGQQGGSVISYVLNDPELSKEYTIRAITRDPTSSSASALAKLPIEVVKADINDSDSLFTALKGAHTVFAMTAPTFGPHAKAIEFGQGKAMADAAVQEGVCYLIFSTLPSVTKVSGGKYTNVYGFDAKADVEEYIRTVPIKSAFFAPGSFMQNFQGIIAPTPDGKGGYVIARHVSAMSQLPLIDIVGDTGKYVGAILAEPEKYEGRTFCAATALYSMEEIAQIISKASGMKVVYQETSVKEFKKHLPPWADMLIEMMLYQEEFGYYGPESKQLVAWAVENARGRVNTFEEYLMQNPLSLH